VAAISVQAITDDTDASRTGPKYGSKWTCGVALHLGRADTTQSAA